MIKRAVVFTASSTYLVSHFDSPKLEGETARLEISNKMYLRMKKKLKQQEKQSKP